MVIRNVFAKTDVSFRDQIKQRQTKVNIIAWDGYDEAQVRVNHPFASCCIAVPDSAPEFDFFIGRQKRHSPHLSQIVVERAVAFAHTPNHNGSRESAATAHFVRF